MIEFKLKDSGKRQEFATGAVRDIQEGKGRYDLLPMHALYRVSRIFEEGAKKYAEENWRKGIPLRRYLDSALRHLCQFAQGNREEDHASQATWNLMCLIETQYMLEQGILTEKSLDNLPEYFKPKVSNASSKRSISRKPRKSAKRTNLARNKGRKRSRTARRSG